LDRGEERPGRLACMTRHTAPGKVVDRLAQHLLGGVDDVVLADELSAWLAASVRFRAFADAHKDKIRKKLRGATDTDARRDVRAELRAAYELLADRRIELAFEAYGSGRPGPDFTASFRGERTFNIEVTRLRRPPDRAGFGRAILAKLRQLPPSAPNALLVAIEGAAAELDVAAASQALRARADEKDEAFFASRGFDGTRGFYDRYLRLGAVFVWSEAASGDDRAATWINRSARIPLPDRAVRACLACLRASA
jgi:hypothetical protein